MERITNTSNTYVLTARPRCTKLMKSPNPHGQEEDHAHAKQTAHHTLIHQHARVAHKKYADCCHWRRCTGTWCAVSAISISTQIVIFHTCVDSTGKTTDFAIWLVKFMSNSNAIRSQQKLAQTACSFMIFIEVATNSNKQHPVLQY
jgi:ABC-type Zn2+ transport system substrate-binding protein/surface adhesin